MRRTLIFLLCLNTWAGFAAAPQWTSFIPNGGQWPAEVKYRISIPSGQFDLRQDGFDYLLYDQSYFQDIHDGKGSKPLKCHGVRVYFENANPKAMLSADLPDGVSRNYFLGTDPAKWAKDLTGYGEITYKNIYPNIDLRLFVASATLKYEFIVRVGGNPTDIKLRYEGQDFLKTEPNGNLAVGTSLGTIQEMKPYNFQEINGETHEVAGGFILKNNTVSFGISEGYDPAHPLVIDPQLIFATYSGSIADNWGHTATYDAEGNLISGGSANASGFPVTAGAFQISFGSAATGTLWDVALLKFNPTGSQLLYATYLGGNQTEIPHSLIVNSKGELLIFGSTSSVNFPTTPGAFNRTFRGGPSLTGGNAPITGMDYVNGSDIFVAKLSANGRSLISSTLISSSANEGLNLNNVMALRFYGDAYRGEIVTDENDNVYIATTAPSSLPVVNVSQVTASVFKLSPDLNTLIWGRTRVIAGYSAGYGLRVAKSGRVYVVGAVKDDSVQPEDGFVAILNPDGSILKYIRLRTDKADCGELIDLDKDENVYVLGISDGGTYPVTAGVYSNPKSATFIHAFDPNLDRTLFSTVVGSGRGTPDIVPTAFLVNECGNIYLAGWGGKVNESVTGSPVAGVTSTKGLTVTTDAYLATTNGSNFYLMMLEAGAKSILYGTFFGNTNPAAADKGDHVDGGTCRFDKRGFVYHAVCACKPATFPTTPGAWSNAIGSGNCNNAAFKFDIDNLEVKFDMFLNNLKKDTISVCTPATIRFLNTSTGGKTYEWNIGNLDRSTSSTETSYTFTKGGEYTITLLGRNPISCKKEAIFQRKIKVVEPNFSVSPDTTTCLGRTVELRASGGSNYTWSPSQTLTTTNTANVVARPTQTTTYTVRASAPNGCTGDKSVTVQVTPLPVRVNPTDAKICNGQSVQLGASGGKTYRWSGENLSDTTIANPIAKPSKSGTYSVRVVSDSGCVGNASVNVMIDEGFRPSFTLKKTYDCGKPATVQIELGTAGGENYRWSMGNGDTLRGNAPGVYLYNRPGTYQVIGLASRGTCTLSVSNTLVVEPSLDVPNVVTPNDDGKNDAFVVGGPKPLKLEVFNRWGKGVFDSPDYQNDWKPPVPPGTYYYLLTLPDGKQCKGWLEVAN